MKPRSKLASNLRAFFGVAQLFTLIVGVCSLALLLVSFALPTVPIMGLNFDDVSLKAESTPLVIRSPTSGAEDIRVIRLTGVLELNPHSSDRGLATAVRWTLLPGMIIGLSFSWVSLGLLRKLCARVERGEIFSEANLRSIRSLGITLVSWSLTAVVMRLWSSYLLGGYLAEHARFSGLNARLESGSAPVVTFPFSDLIIGLLVLLLAEAFRQGLALKKENDLTV